MIIQNINRYSTLEKLQIMEAVWASLLEETKEVESPRWHKQALDEADKRFADGSEGIHDWADVKNELRKRFE